MQIYKSLVWVLLFAPCCLQAQQDPFVSFEIRPGQEFTVEVRWKMAPRTDTRLLVIEKSMDEKNWRVIGRTYPQPSNSYLFTDIHPMTGRNYYRVSQLDTISMSTVSTPVQWLRFNQSAGFFIWPNPARDILHLKAEFNTGSVDVVDAQGKQLLKMIITDYITDIPVTALSKGLYFLNIKNENLVFVERFVKQ